MSVKRMVQNKKFPKLRSKTFILLGVLFLSLLSIVSFSQPTNAYPKIKKSQIKLVADFTLQYKANAGGTITKDYYVFPDTKGIHGGKGSLLKAVSRSSCKQTSRVKLSTSYLSGIYHKWGTNKVALIAMGKQNGCYSVSGGKLKKSSGCSTPPGRTLIYQGTGQGNTATMGGHVFKVAGFTGGIIGVWTSSGKRVATYQIPKSVVNAEPENIAFDGDTGEAYINYAKKKNGKRHSMWYKLNSSVLSKYTGKKGTSNPTICKNNTSSGTTSSSNSGSIYSPTSYDPDNITIRDETYKPGVAQSTYDGTVETNFFGTIKDEDGCGVYTTLSFILDILSVGIGITAVIGIAIAGSTYLSSKGDVAKTTKAKRRIYEIVLGLIAYAVIYALLTFLTPEFNPELKVCKALTPEEVAQIKAENEARIKEAEEKQKAEEAGRTTKGSIDLPTDSGSVSTNIKGADLAGATAVGKKMLQAAEETAQYMAKNKFIYFQYDPSNGYYNKNIKKGYGPYKGEALTWDLAKKGRYSHCSSFVTLVEKKAGLLPDTRGYHSYILKGSIRFKNNNTKNKLLKNFKIVHGNSAKLSTLVNNKKIAPGDVFGYPGMTHTMIFAGKVDGKYWIYEVNAGNNKVLKYSGGLHKKISGSKKVGDILHAR